MIEILGWICTALVVVAFYFNAVGRYSLALFIWICGDIGWVVYDYFIHNWSHATLSTIICIINIYGMRRLNANKMSRKKINKISSELFS